MANETIQVKMGNDIGNSRHKFMINGSFVKKTRKGIEYIVSQPSCNVKIERNEIDFDVDEETIVRNIWDNLILNVDSKAIELPGYYLVGTCALESGKTVDNLIVGVDEKAYHDLPVINTLGNISAWVIDTEQKDGKLSKDTYDVEVEMTTSIPVTQYGTDGAAARHLEKRFMDGEHKVTVFLGKREVKITIRFKFVYVTHEGAPVVFAIQYGHDKKPRKGDIFRHFNEWRAKRRNSAKDQEKHEENENPPVIGMELVDGQYFADLKVLHVAIGDGTTELTITDGLAPKHKKGINHGIGHAIEASIDEINAALQLPGSPRQFISKVLELGEGRHKYYNRISTLLKPALKRERAEIIRGIKDQIVVSRGEIDIILVYGGGSITCYPELAHDLEPICKIRECELFYIPAEYAVNIEAEGLFLFLESPICEKIKKKVLGAAASK